MSSVTTAARRAAAILLASGALALQLTSSAAHAEPSMCIAPAHGSLTVVSSVVTSTDRDVTRQSVPYCDLDLAGVADRAILQSRIEGSVNAVCRGRELVEPGQKWAERECRRAAFKDAMAQVDAVEASAANAAAQQGIQVSHAAH